MSELSADEAKPSADHVRVKDLRRVALTYEDAEHGRMTVLMFSVHKDAIRGLVESVGEARAL
jgi:hypothetical protein